jgi:putative membrane protein
VAAWLLPGVQLADARSALVLALVLGLLNAVVRPLLVLLTLPVTVVTLGLFLLVLNAGMVMLAAKLVSGFVVSGFWSALLFSLIMTLATSILDGVLGRKRKKD